MKTPAIHCKYDALADIETVVENPRNPNTHPPKQVALLAKIIEHQGWRAPIVVSKRSGFVVAGHGRLLAARKLGLAKVPVDRQDFATEADEWAHLIADNKIAELAETDDDLLGALLSELEGQLDVALAGILPNEKQSPGTEAGEAQSLPSKFEVVVECASETEQREVYDALAAEGRTCRLLTF